MHTQLSELPGACLGNLYLVLHAIADEREIDSLLLMGRQTVFHIEWSNITEPVTSFPLAHLPVDPARDFEQRFFLKKSFAERLSCVLNEFLGELVALLEHELVVSDVVWHLELVQSLHSVHRLQLLHFKLIDIS